MGGEAGDSEQMEDPIGVRDWPDSGIHCPEQEVSEVTGVRRALDGWWRKTDCGELEVLTLALVAWHPALCALCDGGSSTTQTPTPRQHSVAWAPLLSQASVDLSLPAGWGPCSGGAQVPPGNRHCWSLGQLSCGAALPLPLTSRLPREPVFMSSS